MAVKIIEGIAVKETVIDKKLKKKHAPFYMTLVDVVNSLYKS